jgi:lambda repressor-like predicted transcriptional regulator
MSSKKITDADKLEIVSLYRQSGVTTTSLARRYGVSNSTIGRLLKASIPDAEYEILIQQKRGSKSGGEEDSLTTLPAPNLTVPTTISSDCADLSAIDLETVAPTGANLPAAASDPVVTAPPTNAMANNRRVRRRSSAPISEPSHSASIAEGEQSDPLQFPELANETTAPTDDRIDALDLATPIELSAKTLIPPPISRTPVIQTILADSHDRYANPPVMPTSPVDDSLDEFDRDDEPEDVNVLAAMFGEEIADGDDDDDDLDAEEWDEAATATDRLLAREQLLTTDRVNVRLMPLSQATLPRTCYIVIDKFAELIVRPLKDFTDLGQISGEAIQQRTLPVFDNHRVAKRFSNQRTQRVIKVPDSRIFYKTTQHLRSKGITCLLVDGNIYSLN